MKYVNALNRLIASLLIGVVMSGLALAQQGFIEGHVHLRYTLPPGMTPPSPARQSTRNSHQHYLPGITANYRTHWEPPRHQQIQLSQAEYLEKAAENLIHKMDRQGVAQALVEVVPGKIAHEEEYNIMREIVVKHSDRLSLVAGGAMLSHMLQDIAAADVSNADRYLFSKLAVQIIREGAVGFGEISLYRLALDENQEFEYVPPDHPLLLLLSDIAARHGVPIAIHMEAIVNDRSMPEDLRSASANTPLNLQANIPALERLLEHNQKTRIIWQDIGWDHTGDMTPALLDRLLAAHPNLCIALRVEKAPEENSFSPLLGEKPKQPNSLLDEKGELQKNWLRFIEKFQDRIIIGSNETFWPVEPEHPHASFEPSWSMLKRLPQDMADKIGRENPNRFYTLH